MIYPNTAQAKSDDSSGGDGARLIDDFLRRTLRVGNPRDPGEIAKALRQRYRSDAIRLDEEGMGLPVPLGSSLIPAEPEGAAPSETPGEREQTAVGNDVEADARWLVDDPSARRWMSELGGWKGDILREFQQGSDAARFGADPAGRERAFLSARRLADYARVARFVGCAAPDVREGYRRLATTLDRGGAVLRVLMGESLFAAGLSDGGFLLQVPVADARQRRDGLVTALRALLGASDATDWGAGAFSLEQLLRELRDAGAPELGVYLREAGLSRALDDLVSDVSRRDPTTLRGFAATSPLVLHQLERLFVVMQGIPVISAGQSAFLQSLGLFLAAFGRGAAAQPAQSGARLVDLAIPLPIAAQREAGADGAGRALLRDLVSWRADYAREVECFAACSPCDAQNRTNQVQLDFALRLVDLAVDDLARGAGVAPGWDWEEWRAGDFMTMVLGSAPLLAPGYPANVSVALDQLRADARAVNVANLQAAAPAGLFLQVQAEQVLASLEWEDLTRTLAPRCADFLG